MILHLLARRLNKITHLGSASSGIAMIGPVTNILKAVFARSRKQSCFERDVTKILLVFEKGCRFYCQSTITTATYIYMI